MISSLVRKGVWSPMRVSGRIWNWLVLAFSQSFGSYSFLSLRWYLKSRDQEFDLEFDSLSGKRFYTFGVKCNNDDGGDDSLCTSELAWEQ